MDEMIRKFEGHSGSSVFLMKNEIGLYVLKNGNIERNVERLSALIGHVNVPIIYQKKDAFLRMQYIDGLDMRAYLMIHDPCLLINFITRAIDLFARNSVDKDYTEIYNKSLYWLNFCDEFPFTKDELIHRLPKILPQSQYHGDMTLENIIFSKNGQFYFIDAVTVCYDSWVFDIAKLRQDVCCQWFLRNHSVDLTHSLHKIEEIVLHKYALARDNYLLILMLLRVFRHCKAGSLEYRFIIDEVKKLWK